MPVITRILTIAILSMSALALHAQEKPPADVSRVDFNNNVRPYGWNNIAVEITANQNLNPDAPNPRYVDDIEVTLTLGYEGPKSGEFSFYQARATVVTIKSGDRKIVGFWMPFDVVERDNLPKEPRFWIVELSVEGKVLDLIQNNKSFSSTFNSRESIENFKRKAQGELNSTDGILVPTYLSPNPYVESREPPAFIRKEQQ